MDRRLPRAGVAIVTAAVLATATGAAARTSDRALPRTSAVPASASGAAHAPATPRSPRRSRTPVPAATVALDGARRLASPACATYADALGGRYPDVVVARGARRALALVTQGVAAALLGLPAESPRAAHAARDRLDASLERLSRSLAAGDDDDATATALDSRPPIRAYAAALGIGACG